VRAKFLTNDLLLDGGTLPQPFHERANGA